MLDVAASDLVGTALTMTAGEFLEPAWGVDWPVHSKMVVDSCVFWTDTVSK